MTPIDKLITATVLLTLLTLCVVAMLSSFNENGNSNERIEK